MIRKILLLAALLYGASAWAGIDTARDAIGKVDYRAAVADLQPLADTGDVEAQYLLGMSYDALNEPEPAFGWFVKAAKAGHIDAQRVVGIYYSEGKGVPKDMLASACWYRESALGGNDKAQRNLGMAFAHGIGLEQNNELAAYWFQQSASQGNAKAQRNLGGLYYFGAGVDKNIEKAVALFETAAKSGVSAAKTDLAKLYLRGDHVPLDVERAKQLFLEAAEEGEISAQYFIGRMYATGEGFEKDLGEAYFWFGLAESATSDEPNPDGWRAHEWRDKLDRKLDAGQKQALIERIKAWKPK